MWGSGLMSLKAKGDSQHNAVVRQSPQKVYRFDLLPG